MKVGRNPPSPTAPREPLQVSGVEARQGAALGVMRHVLWISLVLAVAGMVLGYKLVIG